MKLLVLGIDGGDERIIKGMPMPFLQGLLQTGTRHDVTLDLFSRGWAETFTGHHGHDTGAFYNRPTGDGRFAFTQHFNLDSLRGNAAVKTVWDVLSEQGWRVGVMNVPTTMPAPKVNGFFVSGVGGGSDKSGGNAIPPEACFPAETARLLQERDYVLDIRRGASAIDEMDEFFSRIRHMEERRTDNFAHLGELHKIDFGFVAYMGIARVSYLLMADILRLIERGGRAESDLDRKILAFFAYNDELFKGLVQRLAPQHVLLVSDHGMAPYEHQVNLNVFLQEVGFQQRDESTAGVIKGVGKAIKGMLPKKMRKSIGRTLPGVRDFVAKPDFVLERSAAFGTGYLSGVYLNDPRFGGKTPDDPDHLVDRIVGAFNSYDPARAAGLSARPYAREFKGCRAHAFLPDIWIDHPETVFFNPTGPFIRGNPQYRPFTSFADVVHDMNSGIKGRKPLLCLTGPVPRVGPLPKENLTAAYGLMLACMAQDPPPKP